VFAFYLQKIDFQNSILQSLRVLECTRRLESLTVLETG